MNTKAIYERATTPPEVLEQRKAEQDKKSESLHFAAGIETQNYQQWLQHSVTQAWIKSLSGRKDGLVEQAMVMALAPGNEEERIQIVKVLVAANTLRETVEALNNKELTKVN